MTSKKPINWFLTETGRSFSLFAVSGLGLTAAGIKFMPNTFFLSQYKDFVHHYVNSQPADLCAELQERYQTCVDKLTNINDIHKRQIKAFSVFGFDLFHAGNGFFSKYGSIIGIPVHFTFKSVEDVAKETIMVNQKKVKWTSEAGQKLAEALVLPEKVQNFAICREILSTYNLKLYLQTMYPLLSCMFAYATSSVLNRKLDLYTRPKSLRVIQYVLTGTFSIGMYYLMNDYTEIYYETAVDKELCELGPEYVEAGVIFYDKLMKRNQALRELMGKEGEKQYTKLGNENYLLRQPHVALMHRKQFFEKKLRKEALDE